MQTLLLGEGESEEGWQKARDMRDRTDRGERGWNPRGIFWNCPQSSLYIVYRSPKSRQVEPLRRVPQTKGKKGKDSVKTRP